MKKYVCTKCKKKFLSWFKPEKCTCGNTDFRKMK